VLNTTGYRDTFLGNSAEPGSGDLVDATAAGFSAQVDASYHIRIGGSDVSQIGGQVGWSNLSDIRARDEIRDLDLGLDFVTRLRPVSFTLKGGSGRTDMGFVAQDVESPMGGDCNGLGIGRDQDRTLSLRSTDFVAPMVKAIQEQQATVAAQRSDNAVSQAQVAAQCTVGRLSQS